MLLTTSEDDNATLAKSIHNKPKNEVANKLPNGYVVCDWYSGFEAEFSGKSFILSDFFSKIRGVSFFLSDKF